MASQNVDKGLSVFGKKAASVAARKDQVKSFKTNQGEGFAPDGEQQTQMWRICMIAWSVNGTVTFGRTRRGDALKVRVWTSDDGVTEDYLTNEDDFRDWANQLAESLGVAL